MFGWGWNYPAKKSGIGLLCMGVLSFIHVGIISPGGWQPHYSLASSLVLGGTGCALLAYHALKSGEEDTAAKKIVLVGITMGAPLGDLSILDIVHIL